MLCSASAQLESAVLGRMTTRLFLPLAFLFHLLTLLANSASAQELLDGKVTEGGNRGIIMMAR